MNAVNYSFLALGFALDIAGALLLVSASKFTEYKFPVGILVMGIGLVITYKYLQKH